MKLNLPMMNMPTGMLMPRAVKAAIATVNDEKEMDKGFFVFNALETLYDNFILFRSAIQLLISVNPRSRHGYSPPATPGSGWSGAAQTLHQFAPINRRN
jgi:hypothetical protein